MNDYGDNDTALPYVPDAGTQPDYTGLAVDGAKSLMNLYFECRKMKYETKQMYGKIELARITAKYKACEDFLDRTFGERDKALSKYYSLLDNAVEAGDADLIVAALTGISSIVTKSPLADFQRFVEVYNDTSKPLLDF